MLIRLAQEDDCARIGELWAQLVAYHRSLDAAMPEAAHDGPQRYAARILNLLEDSYSRTYVAVVDEQIVGYITGMIADMRLEMFTAEVTGFIGDVFVEEASRGRGIGEALVRAMEQFFASRDVFEYEWFVASSNIDGQKFWRSLGAREIVIRMRNRVQRSESEG
jgi:GNAT superfamily N-acetyltransferase